jgi:bleomycin hydrolase
MSELKLLNIDCDLDSLQTGLFNNSLTKLYSNQNKINCNPFIFNHEIKPKYKITNQKSSGRCWIFASLNLIRIMASKNLNIEEKDSEPVDLEFSQSYLFFWDKLEKYHRSLQYYLQMKKIDEKSRIPYILYLYDRAMEDGGQWDMVKELIKKYGIVPKQAMPDSHHAQNTSEINKFLREMLKNDYIKLNNAHPSEHQKLILRMTKVIYSFLVGFLGKPPKEFDFVYKTKNEVKIFNKLTPLELLKKTEFNPEDWCSLVNDPRPQNPYNNYYQVEFLGNVKNRHIGWLNIEMNRMEELTKNSLDKNMPVWFGCDVGAEIHKEHGIMDLNIIDYRKAYNLQPNIDKREKLETYLSLPNHAMVIVGYHYNNNRIERWKIENSWGDSSNSKGYLLMTNPWFHQYVYQIVVHKSLLSKNELSIIENMKFNPNIIPPWDALGTLA